MSGLIAHAQPSPIKPTPSFTPTPDPTPSGTSQVQASESVSAFASTTTAVEVWGNESSDSFDDCVLKNQSIPCALYLPSPLDSDMSLTLTSPDDGILFVGGNAQNQLVVTIPANSSYVRFTVTGKVTSSKIGGAVINVHSGSIYTSPIASLPLTVFDFKDSAVSATPVGDYQLQSGRYAPSGSPTVVLKARITIEPSGLSYLAPQIWKVGVLQNALKLDYRRYFSSPVIFEGDWDSSILSGQQVRIPASYFSQNSVSYQTNDSAPTVSPIYDQPNKPDTVNPGSLQAPFGTSAGAIAETSDSPVVGTPASLRVEVTSTDGRRAGWATYSFNRATIDADFVTWCVWFDPSTGTYRKMKETSWGLSITSGATALQKATTSGANKVPVTPEAPPTPFANDELQKNYSEKQNGIAIRVLTRPTPTP